MSAGQSMNVTWHEHKVASADRKKLNGQKSCVIWFTGLSASGKSTIANTVDHKLHAQGKRTYILDGDNIRMGLNAGAPMLKERYGDEFATRFGLGFGATDRAENIRRIGEVAKLFADAGIITLTAFISPYRIDRDNVRALFKDGEFIEVLVKASVETCEKRDPKGLYKKARAGEIKNFTGISDPYEEPLKPELVLDSDNKNIDQLADDVITFLKAKGYLDA